MGIVSGKGGVGTTTTAVNVGCALSSFGRELVVVDCDFKKSNVGMQLGAPTVDKTMHDVVKGKHQIRESAYLHSSGLKVVLGDPTYGSHDIKITSDNLKDSIFSLVGSCELVLVDCGNGLFMETMHSMLSCDKLIFVVEADLVSVTDTLKVIKFAQENSIEILGVIINKHEDDGINMSVSNVSAVLGVPVLGVIPFDKSVRKSIALNHPVCYSHPDSPSSDSFKDVAKKLIGESYAEQLDKEDDKSLFANVLRRIGLYNPKR